MIKKIVWLLCLLGCATSLRAELLALTHDRLSATEQLVELDPASGAAVAIGPGLVGCCEVGLAATAFNPLTRELFALTADSVGGLRLRKFDPTGVASTVGTLGPGQRAVGFAFELKLSRLLAALISQSGELRIVAIDPLSATVSTVNLGSSDCCVINAGLSAFDRGQFHLVGRLRSEPSGSSSLLSFSTSGDNALQRTVIPAGSQIAALHADPAGGGLYALVQRFSAPFVPEMQLASVLPGSGLTPIGQAHANCCAIALGNSAIDGNALQAVGRRATAPSSELSLMSINLSTGALDFSSAPLAANRVINGLFVGNVLSLSPRSGISRQQGSASQSAIIANVLNPLGAALVTVNGGASATSNGLSVSNLSLSNGVLSADVVASCTASSSAFSLSASSGAQQASATLNIAVLPNSPPSLGSYPATNVGLGLAVVVSPSAAPLDTGSISSVTANAPGMSGGVAVNATSGEVTISNAGPVGGFSVSVTATDNCASSSTQSFNLSVSGAGALLTPIAANRAQGSASYRSVIGTLNAANGAGNFTLAVNGASSALVNGVEIKGLQNNNGILSALIRAGCFAPLGASTFTLSANDGAQSASVSLAVVVSAGSNPNWCSWWPR